MTHVRRYTTNIGPVLCGRDALEPATWPLVGVTGRRRSVAARSGEQAGAGIHWFKGTSEPHRGRVRDWMSAMASGGERARRPGLRNAPQPPLQSQPQRDRSDRSFSGWLVMIPSTPSEMSPLIAGSSFAVQTLTR